jgi:hypothetical protein
MTEEIEYEDGTVKLQPLSRKGRGWKLVDQKANSVADMAEVLGRIGTVMGEEIGLRVKDEGEGKNVVVEVRWKDLLDAEFAHTWSENVIHDVLEGGRVESAYGEAVKAAEDATATR